MTEFEPDEGTEEPDEEQTEEPDEETTAPDEETTAPDEQADEAEDEGADALAQKAKMDAYSVRALKYLSKNMSELLGDEAIDYTECPACNYTNTPGFLHVSPCPPELMGFVYDWALGPKPEDLKDDPHSKECDECAGNGKNATKSKVQGQDNLPCVKCNGIGWLPTDDARRPHSSVVPNGPTPLYPPPSSVASGVPVVQAEEDPEVQRLRQLGYAVIPPMTVAG